MSRLTDVIVCAIFLFCISSQSPGLPQDDLGQNSEIFMAPGKNVKKWNLTILYTTDGIEDTASIPLVDTALNWFREHTCLNFTNTTIEDTRIVMAFLSHAMLPLCYSSLGIDSSSVNQQMVAFNCEKSRTIVEDVIRQTAHALGISFEHNRADRDDNVYVYPDNTNDKKAFNIDSVPKPPLDYDFGSVMHWNSLYKSSNNISRTIEAKNVKLSYTMGSRRIQANDIFAINDLYQCRQKMCAKVTTTPQCKNGGKPHPTICTACSCPPFFKGPLCGQRHQGMNPYNGQSCGGVYKATNLLQSYALYLKTNPNIQSECYYIIEPTTPGKKIKISLNWFFESRKNVNMEFCDSSVIQFYRNDKFTNNPISICKDEHIDSIGIREMISSSKIVVRMAHSGDATSVDMVMAISVVEV